MAQTSGARPLGWPFLTVVTGVLVALLLAMFWQTAADMVHVWNVSETFAHGYLIVPITLWLIWRDRHALAQVPARVNLWGLLPLLGLGLVWLLARLVDINVVQQLALVGMIAAVVYTLLGWQVFKHLAFPLAFLFFAVPIGKELIPPMMEFTADFTVAMVELTGIPVYREGMFFELPSGNWSVVEGCSGVRYLIASICLGTLYAYITYRSLHKRLIFIAASIIAPIIANGLRAYMIVMIAHYSDMKLALGVDHFIYGWVFFGLVIFLMFYIGSFWRDEFPPVEVDESKLFRLDKGERKPFLTAAALILLAMVVWPWLEGRVAADSGEHITVKLDLPEAAGWRKLDEPLTDWRPTYVGADLELEQSYEKQGRRVSLYVAYYAYQREGAELVNDRNIVLPEKHPVWQEKKRGRLELRLDGQPVTVKTSLLRSSRQSLYVAHWYWLGGANTSNPLQAKLLQLRNTVLAGDSRAAAILISAEMDESPEPAIDTIRAFVADMLPAIDQALRQAKEARP